MRGREEEQNYRSGYIDSDTVVKDSSEKRPLEKQMQRKDFERNSDKAETRTLSWSETARAAGVLTMTAATDEQSSCEILEPKTAKKKTPKQYRLEAPKQKPGSTMTLSDKKQFKEGFNTDKARFLKRQLKYNRSQNFLILVEDNIHSVGSGSETAGMVMAFGAGELKERFLREGIKFKESEYYMHANATDFTRENLREFPGRTDKQVDERADKQTDERAACPEEPSRKKTKYDLYLEASAKEN